MRKSLFNAALGEQKERSFEKDNSHSLRKDAKRLVAFGPTGKHSTGGYATARLLKQNPIVGPQKILRMKE